MKRFVSTTAQGLDRLVRGRRATRWLMGPALGLVAVVAAVAFSTQVASADRRDFTLYNDSAATVISRVYVSCSECSGWGNDVLGASVLFPGESVDITFTRPSSRCYYDIKIVTSRGAEYVKWGVNLCATSSVTFR